jgi:uncharacterized membrane protein YkoI
MTIEEMQNTINELTVLLQQLIQNQNNSAIALSGVNQPGIPQLSSQRAREIALELIGHGTARNVLLFEENGILMFEVEIRHSNVRYMVYVNARNGSVVRMSRHEDGYQGITTLPEAVPPTGQQPTPPPPSTPPPPQPTPPPPPPPPPGPPAVGTHTTARLDEAGAAAIRANDGRGLIRHICLDRERGVAVYHVRLYDNGNRVDIYLNRSDLSVERHRSREHNSASSSSNSFQRRQMNTTPTLSFNQAANAALSYFGGGTVREVSRSYFGGRGNVTAAFDVDIVATNGQRWCVYVDIHTGAILHYHRD